jgi:ABC-type sugar transport system substrate-binding protein
MTRKIVVGLLSDAQEFQLMQASDAKAAAARAGLGIEVLFADNNAVLQIQQLFRHVHAPEEERPYAIVVETVTGEGLERVARNAVKAGIGWVLVNRHAPYVDALRAERPDLPVFSVGVDQPEVGRIHARQAVTLVPRGGAVLYLQGPADTWAAQGRLQGMQEALKAVSTKLELKVLNGDWTQGSAYKAVLAWLRLKSSENFRAQLIVGQNDSMAVGARQALAELRHTGARDLPATGCDGLPEGGQKLVAEGVLSATVITPTTTGPAIEMLARHLAGTPAPAERILAPKSFPPEDELARRRARP